MMFFPNLGKLCEEQKARFQAIDLHWRVGDEAGLGRDHGALPALS
jgi:hypothetical protein